ncbi:MAG: hypothetical protein VX774_01970 [Candidatus Thermoplasmatota archaeon]|jgi:hypothetical protein|nr:hypothetical protein [Candidatus Thermoplasmatota archaeon]
MAYSDLSPADRKVYDYLRQNDFVAKPWSTAKAAKALKLKPAQVYESLSSIAHNMRSNIHIHYRDGALRIAAE